MLYQGLQRSWEQLLKNIQTFTEHFPTSLRQVHFLPVHSETVETYFVNDSQIKKLQDHIIGHEFTGVLKLKTTEGEVYLHMKNYKCLKIK